MFQYKITVLCSLTLHYHVLAIPFYMDNIAVKGCPPSDQCQWDTKAQLRSKGHTTSSPPCLTGPSCAKPEGSYLRCSQPHYRGSEVRVFDAVLSFDPLSGKERVKRRGAGERGRVRNGGRDRGGGGQKVNQSGYSEELGEILLKCLIKPKQFLWAPLDF